MASRAGKSARQSAAETPALSKRWLNEQQAAWQRLDALLTRAETGKPALTGDEWRELALLYRSGVNDLSRLSGVPDATPWVATLNALVLRGHQQVYVDPPTRWGQIRDYFLRRFPQTVRKRRGFIGFACLCFVIGLLAGEWTVASNPALATEFIPASVIDELKQGKLWAYRHDAAASQASFLMNNNIRVALQAYVSGIVFGLGTLVSMVSNGMFALGAPLAVCRLHQMDQALLNFAMAHGVIELTTIFIAGGAGMMLGEALVFPGERPRWQALMHNARESLVLIVGCIPLLVIAGIIEGTVSLDPDTPTAIRALIAGLSAVFLLLYFGLAGRQKPEASTPQQPQRS